MLRFMIRSCAFLMLLGIGAVVAQQQPGPPMPQPRISAVFPMGCKPGTSVEITITGTEIDDPTGLIFSDPGIKAEIVAAPTPAPVDPKAKGTGMKAKTGPLTNVKFKITVGSNVPAGTHDVRLVSKVGVSNPRAFIVSDKTEVNETDKAHNDVPDAQRIDMGSVVNAVIATQTDVDYYVFAAKAKQRFIVHAAASSIDSKARPLIELYDAQGKRLIHNRNYAESDAVLDWVPPTDGDYYVRVSEFAYQPANNDYFYRLSVSTAPWIDTVYPPAVQPGKASQVTIIGRNLPGGKVIGGQTIDGRPVESLTVTVTPPANSVGKMAFSGSISPNQALEDAFDYTIKGPGGTSNCVPIYLTNNPVILEAPGDNNTPATAQPISVPCEVAGRIEQKHDKDWYSFDAKKGDIYYIELHADRIGSQMDMYYSVKNSANMGNVVEEQDDDPDAMHPVTFYNKNGDPPTAKFVATADSKFLIFVGSRDSGVSYGLRSNYRLVVSKPSPDFRAIVMPKGRDLPTCAIVGQSANVGLDIFIDRRNGFTETVTVTAEGLPTGVTAKPVNIGAGVRWGTLVLTSNDSAAEYQGKYTIKCSATIDGKPVVHEARSASITWGLGQQQQNTPVVSRLDRNATIAVRASKVPFNVNVDLAKATVKTKDKDGKDVDVKLESPVYVRPGDKITLPILAKWHAAEARPNPINLVIEPYQQGNQNAPIGTQGGGGGQNPIGTIAKDKNDGSVTLDVRTQANPGSYAIVIRADTQMQVARMGAQGRNNAATTATSYTLPVEIIVLPTSIAKVTATVPNNTVKLGGTAEITIKVERQGNYNGEYAVQVTMPKELKGVTVKNVVIPAGKDEAKMTLTLDPSVKSGNLQGLSVVVEGKVYGKQTIRNEGKLQVSVSK